MNKTNKERAKIFLALALKVMHVSKKNPSLTEPSIKETDSFFVERYLCSTVPIELISCE